MSEEIPFETLFALAEAGPILDKIERKLRLNGRSSDADAIVKLQQDAGVAIDRVFYGPYSHPGDGTEAGTLSQAYEPVTQSRFDLVRDHLTLLPPADRLQLASIGVVPDSGITFSASVIER